MKRFAKAGDWLGRLLYEAIGWNEQQRLPGLSVDAVDATTLGLAGIEGHRSSSAPESRSGVEPRGGSGVD